MKRSTTAVVLGVILVAAGILRGVYLSELMRRPDFELPAADAEYHDYWARGLVFGEWAPPSHEDFPHIATTPYFRPPGYPFFLAAVYRVFGPGYLAPRVVQMLLGLVNCALAFLLGRRLFGPAAGLLSAAFMGFHWVFLYYEGELLEATLAVTLGLGLVLSLVPWSRGITVRRGLLSGVFLALFALTRPNILPMAPVLLLWGMWLARGRGGLRRAAPGLAAFLAAAVVVLAPAAIRNGRVGHGFFLVSSNAGINLFFGNSEYADGYSPSHPETGTWSCFDYPRIVRELGDRLGRSLSYKEASDYFTRRALDYVRRHPGPTAALYARKWMLFWGPLEVSNEKEDELERSDSPVLRVLPFPFGFILGLGVTGLGLRFLDRRRRPAAAAEDRESGGDTPALVALLLVVYAGTFMPFVVAGRYRVPLIPFLLVFAAYALVRVAGLVRSRAFGRAAGIGIAAAVLTAAASFNLAGYAPDLAQWHFDRGLSYGRAGDIDAAVRELQSAVAARPSFSEARVNLGVALSRQGRFGEAAEQYAEALSYAPKTHETYNNLGDLLARQGRTNEALAAFGRALELNPDFLPAHMNLGLYLEKWGRPDPAVPHLETVLRRDPKHAGAHAVLGLIHARAGRYPQAVEHLRQAVAARPDDLDSRANLGFALYSLGRVAESVDEFQQVVLRKPDHLLIQNTLAWIESTSPDPALRNGRAALTRAMKVCDATGHRDPGLLDTLAAAYAENGEFENAAAAARKALEGAEATGQSDMAAAVARRLALYEQGRPYRDPAAGSTETK